jgi:hypothetical protein
VGHVPLTCVEKVVGRLWDLVSLDISQGEKCILSKHVWIVRLRKCLNSFEANFIISISFLHFNRLLNKLWTNFDNFKTTNNSLIVLKNSNK